MVRWSHVAVVGAAAGLACIGGLLLTLPSPRIDLRDLASGEVPATPVVAGALHVHSRISDGTGTAEEIAAAAARAGLQFVVLTDHGDGTDPAPPQYLSGVLCFTGVEISTNDGHYLALDLPEAPYPLGGDARDVVADVRRLGGFGVAAHPGSLKTELAWRDWSLPVDGVEWINADSEWRDEPPLRLVRGLFDYLVRPPEALASVLDRPEDVLERWDAATQARRVVALAGADAHARIGLGGERDPYTGAAFLEIPAYSAQFQSFTTRVLLSDPPSGDAATDARAILEAIHAGRLYTAIDGLAGPPAVVFEATSGPHTAAMGERLTLDGPVTVRAAAVIPDDAKIVLIRNGRVEATDERAGEIVRELPAEPAVLRMEVRLASAPGTPPVPWIFTNPIYLGDQSEPSPPPARAMIMVSMLYDDGEPEGWAVETNERSRGALQSTATTDGEELAFRFALGGDEQGAHAALTRRLGDLEPIDVLTFRARASRPLRLVVQLRAPGSPEDRRWRWSSYLDEDERSVQIPILEMIPATPTTSGPPELRAVESLLFVVDTVNTALGTNGVVWLDDVRLERFD